jgi:hypothetical protein
MTTRERWYAYWRAKRAFDRHVREQFVQLMIYGRCTDHVTDAHPIHEYIPRAIDMALNPPIIYDPILRHLKTP